jgi:type II secretory pathway component PulF
MNFFSSLSNLERLFFAKHLSIFLRSGIPLSEALETMVEEDGNSAVGRSAQLIRAEIENGQSLKVALAKQPHSFDLLFISMIEIGETSGTLDKSLDFLTIKIEREEALRKKIQGMLYYPVIVVVAACAIGAFISFFILPKLGTMFHSFDVKLPLATRILLFLADGAKNYGFFALLFIIGIIVFIRILLSRWYSFRFFWHKLKFQLPVIGKVISSVAFSAFFRNLGTMLSSGLSLEYALRTESEISENLVIRKTAKDLHGAISQGRKMGEELKKTKQFPMLCAKMISAGEMSGKLEESLLYLADYFEDETETRAKNATAFFEPLLLLFIGLLVGFVALAVMLPIYSLTGSIHR